LPEPPSSSWARSRRTIPESCADAAQGHEIACHGNGHDDVYRLSPGEFRADIRKAKSRIEDAVGDPVTGYRAPNFSIGQAQSWAYKILLEEGFRYDSSTYPILHDRYGQPSAPRVPYEIWRDGSASLMEFPIGTARLLGVNLRSEEAAISGCPPSR
jgi:peptidoglycan/xylan/chitin deacetylase (PgdA/CDA1 family)